MTEDEQILFCRDCRWIIVPSGGIEFARCRASETINVVTAEFQYEFCEFERRSFGGCGPFATRFEMNELDDEPGPLTGDGT